MYNHNITRQIKYYEVALSTWMDGPCCNGTPSLYHCSVGLGEPVTVVRRVTGQPSVTWLSVSSTLNRGATAGGAGAAGGSGSGAAETNITN